VSYNFPVTNSSTDLLSKFDHTVVAENIPAQKEMQIVVYSRLEKASKVCNFHFEMSDLP
jgi:ribosomal protein L30E